MKSDCEIFNLAPDSSKEDLKKSFRKLAFVYHPDLGGDEKKFIEIKDAYDRLLLVFDPSSIQSAEKLVEEFLKEMVGQYNQAFPWRADGIDLLAESKGYNREYVRRNKYLKNYLTNLARNQLSDLTKQKLLL